MAGVQQYSYRLRIDEIPTSVKQLAVLQQFDLRTRRNMTQVRNNFESHGGESQSDFKLPDFSGIAEDGLYVPELERDACGVGMVANITGAQSHKIIDQALEVLVNLGHRGAAGADPARN